MIGLRKASKADMNISCYALQNIFYATFWFDTLALSYFILKIIVKNRLARKPQKCNLLL